MVKNLGNKNLKIIFVDIFSYTIYNYLNQSHGVFVNAEENLR